MPQVNRKAPNERHVQSLAYAKDEGWTYEKARDDAKDKGHWVDGHDETDDSHRFRQYDPEPEKFDYRYQDDENTKGLTKNMGYPKDNDNDNNDENADARTTTTPAAGNALKAITSRAWAIREEVLEYIMGIATRTNGADLQALQQRLGRPLENTRRVTVRETKSGNVAVIPVTGPIFKGANLFTEISGATSNEDLVKDITTALEDPQISGLVLNINSPGGTVEGTQEVAHVLYDNRGVKPITAYVDGEAASGAYWIASAADRIVLPRTGMVGSIGVVATVQRRSDKSDVREVVSSASPNKRPDVDTDEGYQEILATVDDLANEFITDVAQFRGVTEDRVRNHFGRGGMRVGRKAVKAVMADELQNRFEKFLPTVLNNTGGGFAGASASEPARSLSFGQALGKTETQTEKEEEHNMKGFKELLGKGAKGTGEEEQPKESEAAQQARAERLQAAFPEDEQFAEEQYNQGHDVADAVKDALAAKDTEHQEAVQAKDQEIEQLKSERDQLKQERDSYRQASETAQQQAEEASKRAQDAQNRPAVVGAEGGTSDDAESLSAAIKQGFESRRN